MPMGEQPPPDVSGHRKQILHCNHLNLLVSGDFGQCLEVHLHVSRNDADYMSGLVSPQNQCLEHLSDVLPKAVSYMSGGKVVLVKLIRDKSIPDACLVEKAGHIGLFNFLSHKSNDQNVAKVANRLIFRNMMTDGTPFDMSP